MNDKLIGDVKCVENKNVFKMVFKLNIKNKIKMMKNNVLQKTPTS